MDEGAQYRGDELICVHCVNKERELLRIGMRAGRAFIEKPRAIKHSNDTHILSLFDAQRELF